MSKRIAIVLLLLVAGCNVGVQGQNDGGRYQLVTDDHHLLDTGTGEMFAADHGRWQTVIAPAATTRP
jgi:hypothetical protein